MADDEQARTADDEQARTADDEQARTADDEQARTADDEQARRPAGERTGPERVRPPAENPELCVAWFKDLWLDVCLVRARYLLPVRSRWWENPVQVEALAAFTAWVERYDSGEWDDPPGKLALLYDLERVSALLREGDGPFDPERDRPDFNRFLETVLSGGERSERPS